MLKFKRFIVYCWKVINKQYSKTFKFHQCLSAIFLGENVPLPPFLYYWRALKVFLPTFSTVHQILPSFTTSYQLLYYFYQLLSSFTNFHQLLLPSANFYNLLLTSISFYTTFRQPKMVTFIFFIFWHAPIPPSCLMPCYRH